MNKNLKKYITILLLAIFPISAVGLNISVHKCQHKGSLHITFYGSASLHFNSNCCSSMCDSPKSSESVQNCFNSCKMNNETYGQIEKSGISYLNSTCCTNTDLSYSINLALITSDKNKSLLELPMLSYIFFQMRDFALNDLDNKSTKEIQFPLREPICNIISFIHYTSLSGEDSDTPNHLYC